MSLEDVLGNRKESMRQELVRGQRTKPLSTVIIHGNPVCHTGQVVTIKTELTGTIYVHSSSSQSSTQAF